MIAAWGIVLANAAMLVARWVKHKYMTPDRHRELRRDHRPDRLKVSHVKEGERIPLIYGTTRVAGNVVWAGKFAVEENLLNGDLINYRYRVALQMKFGTSNARIGSGAPATFLRCWVGDKILPIGTTPDPEVFTIDENDFYGGLYHGGGINGRMIFQGGSWDQVVHPTWSTIYGTEQDATLLPAHRGQIQCVLIGAEGTGILIGESPYLETWSLEIAAPVSIPGRSQGLPMIGGGDANPASVLIDLLTHRAGIPESDVDVDAFATAATVFEQEQHGISIAFTTGDALDHIKTIEEQTDCAVFRDQTTGKYTIKLVRNDYDPDDPNECPHLTQADLIGEPRLSSSTWDEVFNEVRVIYPDRSRDYTDRVAIAQNGAVVTHQGGRRRVKEVQFPGVSNAALAARLAARELNMLSRPMMRLEAKFKRTAFRLQRGSPFKFTWVEDGITFSMVFRVADAKKGTLESGEVTIVALQDRFDFTTTVMVPPDVVVDHPPQPDPVIQRLITEAPRWVLLKAYEQGAIANVDAQRGYYLAKAEGVDSRYKVQSSIDGAAELLDLSERAFPGTFTVETQYARTTSAYDTTTGLRITNVVGWTPGAATQTEIAALGKNGIVVGTEILFFESYTDLGGGVGRLNNVWRGGLDTVPAKHAVGTRGYVLPGDYAGGAIGARVLVHNDVVVTHVQAAAGSTWVPSEDSPEDTFAVRQRTLLPYPGADLLVNGAKAPVPLEEGGVTLMWNARDRLKALITRPNVGAETLEALTTFDAVAVKGHPVTPGNETLLAQGISTSSTTQHPIGAAGHGALQVGVRTRRTGVALSDGTTPIGGVFNWQTPLLDLTAHHWRNLLLNPRFASGVGLLYWTAVSGTPTTSNAGGLGNNSFYVTGQSGTTVEIQQTIPIAGYLPKNYAAILDFFTHNGGDTGDTVQVDLIALDAAMVALQTQTYGPLDPGATWGQNTLTIADLHDNTASLRVRIVLNAVGELDNVASCRVTELCLRVGQISPQLLANPSFEAGLLSWSATVGLWQILTATKYDLTNYVRPQDGAAAQLRQAVAVPTGFEGSAAVLEGGRMNDDVNDTGAITLEALDAGSNVVGSVTTGAQAISPSNAWVRRRLVLDPIPATATQLRVTLDATRVTGTALNSCFDGFDLRCHKHLDPDEETQLFEDLAFVEQPLPRSVTDWKQHFPTVPAPDYAIYDGGLVGRLGVEPLLEAGAGCFAGGKAVVSGPEGNVTTCFESAGTSTTADEDIHTAPVGDAFANFGTSDPFTALAFVKADGPIAAVCGVMGRVVGSRGWEMRLNASGTPRVVLYGANGPVTVGGGEECDDAALHGFALIYDNASELLHVVDATGDTSTSTAGMGEIRATTPGKFRIMATGVSGQNRFAGQVVRAYIWRQALTPAQVAEVLRYAEAPFPSYTSGTRTGTVACVVGSDSEGVLVDHFGPDRAALALDAGSGRVGLVGMPALDNLAPADWASGDWSFQGAGSFTPDTATDPTGRRIAGAVAYPGTLLLGYNTPLHFGATGTRHLSFFARGAAAHTMEVVLTASSEDAVAVEDFNVTTQWQLFTWEMPWDDTVADEFGYLQFYSTTPGNTLYLSPIMFVGGTAARPWPGTIPIGSPGATSPLLTIAPSAQFNREGEIEVELVNFDEAGVIANAWNNASSADARLITWPATGGDDIGSAHYDADENDDTTAQINNTAIDIAQPWKARLRWNRAGTVDGFSSTFVVLRAEQGGTVEQDGGRAAAWNASTTLLTRLALLHELGATNAMAGLVFSARISARERKV